ncbi:MAG: hypothetical protein ACI8TP_000895 [Acidimicrobiales bacterium]
MNHEEAEESVGALVDDLRFLMGSRPHTAWPDMAEAAIEHHTPFIAEELLSWQQRRLQRAAHLALEGLAVSNAEQIRAGILDIRTIESVLTSDGEEPLAPERPGSAINPNETIHLDAPIIDLDLEARIRRATR